VSRPLLHRGSGARSYIPHWNPVPPGRLIASITEPITGSQPAKCAASATGSPAADHDSRTDVRVETNPT